MSIPQIVKVDPDSQYKLIPCPCGNTETTYAKRPTAAGGVEWAAGCHRCGKMTKWHPIRHHAQLEWNGGKRPSWDRD